MNLKDSVAVTDVWTKVYSELLGCEADHASIIIAIQALQNENKELTESIPRVRKNAVDALILSMRKTAVNCGMNSTCSVSHWYKTTEELENNHER